ncbi:penicillin-binding transpeptidase domain-containing protein [Peribacillus huizhouensis]|uniref:serine-type D-Ala-D-Ala carboxypeptidase n=1 Tax=Peribacillus huizhouensis TaxID=1501239 RepID=A0ABR6CSE8_9BACI|nr:penicillin-binding transpeptidase domain-containing protein [Peribacillus huizhouensis]MBA9027836.1 penicillin-binding protein [Peribacillus huizhouensis]
MKKILFISILFVILSGCSDKGPVPEDRFAAYVKLWNEQNYEEMYKYLSSEAKKTINEKDFTERYEKIYRDIKASNLKIAYKKPKETTNDKELKETKLPFSVSMNTMAGSVKFDHQATLVKEGKDDKENWYIDWNTTYIFPELEEGDKVSITTYPAIRGEIVDRNEQYLAMNGSVVEVGIVPEEMADPNAIITQTSKLLHMSKAEVEKKLNQSWVKPNYFVPLKKVAVEDPALKEALANIPSIHLNEVAGRVYPYKEVTAHLIGYIGEITAEELKTWEKKGYRANDVIGKRGLEQILEERLKGKPGAKISVNTERGQEKIIAEKKAEEGETIVLTIDVGLQQQIFAQYKGESGSAVALNPLTGETLALVSSPSFDPNQYVLGMTAAQQEALESDPNKPLINRFSATFSPGSTIKGLTASIAMKNGINPNEAIEIKGKTWKKSNWKDHSITRVSTPGKPINMTDALVYSDNIYFAQKALQLGTDKFSKGLKDFGFDENIPFEYAIKASQIGKIDSEGRLADSGYGQGQVLMSPLHVALSYTTFVNEGNMIAPKLFLDGNDKPAYWKENVISKDQATQMTKMLTQVVSNRAGSAHSLSETGIPLAGKTGTAEIKQSKESTGTENGWFVGYNTDNPRLLMTWMMENVKGRGGSHLVVDKMKPVWVDYLNEVHE